MPMHQYSSSHRTRNATKRQSWFSVAAASLLMSSTVTAFGISMYPTHTPVITSFTIRNAAGCLLCTSTQIKRSSTTNLGATASSSSSSCSSSLPTKSKSKKNKTAKKRSNHNNGVTRTVHLPKRQVGPGRTLTHEELVYHVNVRYLENKNGLFGKLQGSASSILTDDENIPNADDTTVDNCRAQQYLQQLNCRPSLVLNADYQPLSYLPLSLWSWQDAVKAIFSGKVSVVDVYPDITVRAATLEVPLPSVIALTDYVPHIMHKPAFTRRNVFLRDEYKCQYCNDRFHTADLSLDHVVPRSQGGTLHWENAVTCCLKCNGRKGSMPLSRLPSIGMKLLRTPKCPTQMELAARAARMVPKRVHPTWKPYLGIAKRPSGSASAMTGDEEFIDDRYFEESHD